MKFRSETGGGTLLAGLRHHPGHDDLGREWVMTTEKVRGYVSCWPPIIRDFWEAYGRHEVEVPLDPPAAMPSMARTRYWRGCGLALEDHPQPFQD
jgi:acyl CoA:acetate/3-ketoacid CoA transferase alpha subunit